MSVYGVSQNKIPQVIAAQKETKTDKTTKANEENKQRGDSVSISKDFYSKSKVTEVDSKKIEELKAQMEKQTEEFKQFIQSMIVKQGEKHNFTLGKLKLNVTQADVIKAKEAVSEGGEFSVDAVATRIIDMAKALSGGDPSKIGILKDAVIKGFEAAGLELGLKKDKMPEITNKTYDEVMKRFDQWEKGDVE